MHRMIARTLAAAALLLAGTAAAQADPISAAILGIFISGTIPAWAISITTALLGIAASFAVSYLFKAKVPEIEQLPGGTVGKLQSGGVIPRSFIVGRAMTSGSLVYANTYSPAAVVPFEGLTSAAAGNTPNAYLAQVIALSDLPVTGLVDLLVSGEDVTIDFGNQEVEGFPVTEYQKDGKNHLWIRFYNGTQTAADTHLVSLFATDLDRPYQATRIGTGMAYAVVTALVNQELFPSFPQFKFVLDGVPLYDRRFDSSVGGSGAQRFSDPSTWAFTGNPVVIAENILRGLRFASKWVYGAQTVAAAQLPSSAWVAAASECDVAIDLLAGGTEPQFVAGGEIRFSDEPAATLEELLKSCNGRLAEIGGTYKVLAGAAGAAVFSITDGDILSTEQQVFDPFPGLQQTVNAVTAKYISRAEGWNAKDAPPLYDAALETADGGRRQAVDVSYSFVQSPSQVQRLMKSALFEARAFRRHTLPLPPDANQFEPNQVIAWDSSRNGYIAKLFIVLSLELRPDLNVIAVVRELDPNAYDWVPGDDEKTIIDGTIVPLRPASQPIIDWFAEPWIIESDDRTVRRPGIKLSWDPDTDDVVGIHFQIRRFDTGEIVYENDAARVSAGAIIIGQNLLSNTHYQARGKYVPASARDTTYSAWLDVTTPDIRTGIAEFNRGLAELVTNEFRRTAEWVNGISERIARRAGEQDAANALTKFQTSGTIKKVRDVLIEQIGGVSASVEIVRQAGVDLENAFASYQVTVSTTLGNISSSVTSVFNAFSNHVTGAFAQLKTNVEAKIGEPEQAGSIQSSVNSVATSIADFVNGAFADLKTVVSAKVWNVDGTGELQSSVTTQGTAIAGIDGALAARYLISVAAGNHVASITGYAGQDPSGLGSSGWVFNAEFFKFQFPGINDGNPINVLQISNRTNAAGVTAPAIVFRADMYGDGTITAKKLNVAELTAISANFGSAIVSGLIASANGKLILDFDRGDVFLPELSVSLRNLVPNSTSRELRLVTNAVVVGNVGGSQILSIGAAYFVVTGSELNLLIDFFFSVTSSDPGTASVYLYINGDFIRRWPYTYYASSAYTPGATGYSRTENVSLVPSVTLSPGTHLIDVRFGVSAGTGQTVAGLVKVQNLYR